MTPLKNILCILLAVLLLLQSCNKTWVVFSFKVNQDYIAKVLCINRAKPEMHCDGNCILMQRIKAAEENEQREVPQKVKEQKEALYCLEIAICLSFQANTVFLAKETPEYYHHPFTPAYLKAVFHPPDSRSFVA